LSNAIKYIDPNKDQNLVSVQAEEVDSTLMIRVNDNGVGIEMDQLENIFKMFYRASQSAQGAGLGLYIAHETAEKLGGKIMVESEHKHGTTFTFMIPKSEGHSG